MGVACGIYFPRCSQTLPRSLGLARVTALQRTVRAPRVPERRFRSLALTGSRARWAPQENRHVSTAFRSARLFGRTERRPATGDRTRADHCVCRGVSEECARRRQRRLHQGHWRQGGVKLRGELCAGDTVWQHERLTRGIRACIFGNKLVLIAPVDSKLGNVTIGQGFDIAKLAADGRIAVADVKAVPAGLYVKAALEKLGTWAAAEPKLAQAENVRATLAFVARGETPVGIVYETDAKIEPKVKIIATLPDSSYRPVTYPVAATSSTKKSVVGQYLNFLRSAAAKAVFERYGFSYLIKPVS